MCIKNVWSLNLLLLIRIFALDSIIYVNSTSLVTLPTGQIAGHQLVTKAGNPYYAFQEIPYASPPIGKLRFMESIPPKPWTGILNTTENTKICYQLTNNDERENEDCLYLNVYTPLNPENSAKLLPVYFWIHTGAFIESDGTFKSHGPQFFMDQNIVMVIINYRLGPFGFLSTEDGVIRGNRGIKDQHLALKWTKENIRLFGGDPSKITIGGQSAGSASVGYHIISKKSKGLFRGAIMESGSPLCSKMLQRNPRYYAYQLGSVLNEGFNSNNSSEELLALLQNADAADIKNKSSNIYMPLDKRNCVGNQGNTMWVPVIENELDDSFIDAPMQEDVKKGNINLVPILIGFNSEEELSFDLDDLRSNAPEFDNNVTLLVNGNLNIKLENKQLAGMEIKNIYTKGVFQEDFGAFVKFISDAKYTVGVTRHAHLQSRYTDVYFYQFSYRGKLGNSLSNESGLKGVGHSAELKYLFSTEQTADITDFPEADGLTHLRLLRLWTNFVKDLNPTLNEEILLQNVTWPKVSANNFQYLDIDTNLEIRSNPRQYNMWKQIYSKYAEKVLTTY